MSRASTDVRTWGRLGTVSTAGGRPRLSAMLCVLALALTGRAWAGPGSVFSYESDPRDYLGGGRSVRLTDSDGNFSASHSDGFVEVRFDGATPGSFWRMVFRAKKGAELQPGTYEATNAAGPRHAWFWVGGDGRSCGFMKGTFVVREAIFALDGAVEHFAVDFLLHCENADPIFAGYVRYRSSILPPAERTPTPTPKPDSVVLSLRSEPSDPVGRGRAIRVDRTRGTAPSQHYLAGGLLDSLAIQVGGDSSEHWVLEFAAPLCSRLEPRAYAGAEQLRHQVPQAPGIDLRVYRNGGAFECRGLTGSFTIREAHFGPDGEVYRFVADVEQRCLGDSGPLGLLSGSISYESARPSPTTAPPTPTPSYSDVAVVYASIASTDGSFTAPCAASLLTLAEGEFITSYENGVVSVLFDGGANSWWFEFGAEHGGELIEGVYTQVSGDRARRAGQPWVSISGPLIGCDDARAQFTVKRAGLDDSGRIDTFEVDFAYTGLSCGSGFTSVVYGTLRIGSDLPPPTVAAVNPPTPTLLPACWGDCDGDRQVTVDELVSAVSWALGSDRRNICARIDANRDDFITVDELILAVQSALQGCEAAQARTPAMSG